MAEAGTMMAGVIWAWLSAWAIGAGVVLLCWPRERWRRDHLLLLGLGLLAGLGVTSVVYVASSFLPTDERLLVGAVVEGFALVALGVALRRKWDGLPLTAAEHPEAPALPRVWVWCVGIGVIQGAVLAGIVAWRMYQIDPHGGWDAWAIWNLQARAFFRTEGTWPELMQQTQLAWAHGDYPKAVPASVARLWQWAGAEPAWIAAGVSASFAAATVLVVTGVLSALRSPLLGAIGGFILLTMPGFVLAAPSAHADIPLGAFMAAAVTAALMSWRTEGAVGPAMVAGLMTGLAAWTKNEGLLFAVVFLPLYTARVVRTGQKRLVGFFLLGLAVAIAPTVMLKLSGAPPNDVMADVGSRWWSMITDGARHEVILNAFIRDATTFTGWTYGLYPVMGAALLLPPWGRRVREGEGWVLPLVALMACGYYAVYLISPHDLNWHLNSSLVRLYLQLAPVALVGWALWLPPWSPKKEPGVSTWRAKIAFVGTNVGLSAALVIALAAQPRRGELTKMEKDGNAVVLTAGEGWYPSESDGGSRWWWSRGRASLVLNAQTDPVTATLSFHTRSLQSRTVWISSRGRELWRGEVGEAFLEVTLPPLTLQPGANELWVEISGAPVKEGRAADARELGLMIYDPRLQ